MQFNLNLPNCISSLLGAQRYYLELQRNPEAEIKQQFCMTHSEHAHCISGLILF